MKRESAVKKSKVNRVAQRGHYVAQRLDESLPLLTDEWVQVEQMLMRLTEFAPTALIEELVNSLACYADDQARRGYELGQEDANKMKIGPKVA